MKGLERSRKATKLPSRHSMAPGNFDAERCPPRAPDDDWQSLKGPLRGAALGGAENAEGRKPRGVFAQREGMDARER
jgi:hypothetical protein